MNDKNYLSLFSSVAIIVIGGFLFGGLVYNSDNSYRNKAEIVSAIDVPTPDQSSIEDVDDSSGLEVSVEESDNIDNIDPTKIVDIETRDDIDAVEEESPADEPVVIDSQEEKDIVEQEENEVIPEKTVVGISTPIKSQYISLTENTKDSFTSFVFSIRNVSILTVGDDIFVSFITPMPSKVNIILDSEETPESMIEESGFGYKLNHFIKIDRSHFSNKSTNTISIFARSPRGTSSFISTFDLN